jgi:hypothetical protein
VSVVLGCGGGGSGLSTMGMLGIPSSAVLADNVMIVDAALNGYVGGRLLVDTGSPFTLVDPGEFPGATLAPTTQVTVNIGIGSATIDAVPALQLVPQTMNDLHLAGILGANVTRQFSAEFNYRDQLFRIGTGSEPAGVAQPGSSVGFTIAGGGTVMDTKLTINYPATRIPVTVAIEGVDHPFILDTGASEVTVRSTLFTALTADGRAILRDLPIATVAGAGSATVSRVRSVSLGGEEVPNVPVMTLGTDDLLDHLTMELGHPVDGLLGGGYLREFLLTIDYPHGMVHLRRYDTREHIVDEFQRIGIALGPSIPGSGYQITTVFAGTDAARQGIQAGDLLLSIDGQSLASLDSVAADRLLAGTVGTSHQLGMGQAVSPALANQTITVLVDDLIPPPPAN